MHTIEIEQEVKIVQDDCYIILEPGDVIEVEENSTTGTFKCPTCGGKVLKNTKYCVSCKKKVKDPAEEKK